MNPIGGRSRPRGGERRSDRQWKRQPSDRDLMKDALQEVPEGEVTEVLGAAPEERTEGRRGYRAGYYSHSLVTRVRERELRVPRDGRSEFSTALFERYARGEKSLVAAGGRPAHRLRSAGAQCRPIRRLADACRVALDRNRAEAGGARGPSGHSSAVGGVEPSRAPLGGGLRDAQANRRAARRRLGPQSQLPGAPTA